MPKIRLRPFGINTFDFFFQAANTNYILSGMSPGRPVKSNWTGKKKQFCSTE